MTTPRTTERNSRTRRRRAAICFALLTLFLSACSENDPQAPVATGFVLVTVEPSGLDATWEVGGPEGPFLGGGDSTLAPGMPVGQYTVLWGARLGWVVPPNETLNLTANDTIQFAGTYEPLPPPATRISSGQDGLD